VTGLVTSLFTAKMDLRGLKTIIIISSHSERLQIIEIRAKRQPNTKLLPSLRETKRRLLVCVTTSIHIEKQENGSLSTFKSLVQSPVAMLRACPHAVFDSTMC